MMAGGVTHEHLRMLLPHYAAGALTSADAEAVRAHLATGCADCLGAFYRMPIGMPRDVMPAAPDQASGDGPAAAFPGGRVPAPAGPASGATPSWFARAVGLAIVLALIIWAVSAWGAPPA